MAAGPSRKDGVEWQGRLKQDFQARQNQQSWNHGHTFQERYVEAEHQHAAHLAELLQQQAQQRVIEALQHQAHLAEVQRQGQMGAQQHQAHLTEVQ